MLSTLLLFAEFAAILTLLQLSMLNLGLAAVWLASGAVGPSWPSADPVWLVAEAGRRMRAWCVE